MKTIEAFLFEINNLNIKLWEENGQLRYSAPKGSLTPELRAALSERKTEILSFLQQANIAMRDELPPILPAPRKKELPLSFAQERLWFLAQLMPENASYNVPVAIHLRGPLNIRVLEQSLLEMIQRHEILRTTFSMGNGTPVQMIQPLSASNFKLSVIDLLALSSDRQTVEVHHLTTDEAQRAFHLEQGPLLRAKLLQLQSEEHVLLLTLHHIITDRWSMGVFFRELSLLYDAFLEGKSSPLAQLPIQYVDFAHWQRQCLRGDRLKAHLNYWKKQLADAPQVLHIPGERSRPPVHTYQGRREGFELTPELTRQLKSLSQQSGATLFMISIAAFALLLNRYSGQEDIVIGSPMSNRRHKTLESLIGCFVNTLALRIDISGNPTFLALLERVRQTTLEAYAHRDLPFEQVIEGIQAERDTSRNPLIQVMLAFQNAPFSPLTLKGLTAGLAFTTETVSTDLEFHLWEHAGRIVGGVLYYKEVFETDTIVRLLGHFKTLLAAIANNPECLVSDYSLLNEAERRQLLVEWNATATDYPQELCIHQLFETQVEQTPEAIAVICESAQLTYRELNTKVNQLAYHLRTLGVKSEVLVGICVERSLEMMIGLLGVLKAGGAYVPLDPSYPRERIAFMAADSQVQVLVTQSHLIPGLPSLQTQIVCLDTDWNTVSQQTIENPNNEAASSNLAYVIYTSGSTGQPKGVQVAHQSLTNFLTAMRQSPGLTGKDVVLVITTISFDIAVLELYLPLLVGAKIILLSRETASDGVLLREKLLHPHITMMQATPATWRMLLIAGWKGNPHLKILVGGEALSRELAHQLQEKGACVWNLYGPTETTVWSTCYQIGAATDSALTCDTESIGRPIANTQIYILDKHLHPTSIGIPGELHIGGDGLARGYLHRADLTTKKFVPNPFSHDPKSRLYKTGDLARYLPDGHIEYLGRLDNQVKIRGFRVELGEIETILAQHLRVREAVVLALEDRPGEKRLIAYLIPAQSEPPSISELRSVLKHSLPEYMIPAAFEMLEEFPLTPNGKIDRRALPAPQGLRPELDAVYVKPRTDTEQRIATVWQDLLQVKQVGIHDNFFDVGGHSLLAVQMHQQLQEALAHTFSLIDLFHYPTIAALAQYLEAQKRPSQASPPSVERDDMYRARNKAIKQTLATLQKHTEKKPRNTRKEIEH